MGLTDLMETSQKAEIKYIEFEKIRRNELNDAPIIQLEELANSILENGLKEPLNVYRTEDGNYVIDGGERRYTAIMKFIFACNKTFNYAGKECDDIIPVIVLPRPENELDEYESISADNERREFENDDDFLVFVEAVLKRYDYFVELGMKPKGEKREWIGKIIGKAGRTASIWIKKVEEKNGIGTVIPDGAEKGANEDNEEKEKKTKVKDLKKELEKLKKSCSTILELASDQSYYDASRQLESIYNLICSVAEDVE